MNRFSRHPVFTLVLFVFFVVMLMDGVLSVLYVRAKGCSLAENDRKKSLALNEAREAAERTYRVSSPIYHHGLAPYASRPKVFSITGQFYPLYTNSLGFKDRGVRQVPLRTNHRRILFIGDSFTEGFGLPYEKTFVGQIGNALEKRGVEVLNAAVISYSPVIYWRKIKYLKESLGLQFDEAVVFVDISDIQDEALFYHLDKNGNVADIQTAPKPKKPDSPDAWARFQSFTAEHSLLGYAVLNICGTIRNLDPENWPYIITERSCWTYDKKLYRRWGRWGMGKAAHYMDALYGLLERDHIRMIVAVYPWPDQIIHGDLNSIQETFWRGWCKRRGIPFIDYFPDFIRKEPAWMRKMTVRKYYVDRDVHWNENGHKLAADKFLSFYDRLAEEGNKQIFN